MKKSWKTSLGGIAAILAGLSAAITLWNQDNISEAISTALAAVGTGYGLICARDNNVTSQAAGATTFKPIEPTTPTEISK